MIYIYRLKFNLRSKRTWSLINQPYEMHRMISRAFSEDKEEYRAARLLYRVEEHPEKGPQVIVQSKLPADWTLLEQEHFIDKLDSTQAEFSFAEGRSLTFRLRANPCRFVKGEKRGERAPMWDKKPLGESVEERDTRIHKIEMEREAWMNKKAESSGFRIISLTVTPEGVSNPKQGANSLTLNSVMYEGVLRVTNSEIFLTALESGIGPAKGFGFGLLSLARV